MNFKISDHVLADCEFEGSKLFDGAHTASATHAVKRTGNCTPARRANFELIIKYLGFFLTPGILIYVF